eukprot:3237715-Amphidinium_carterae.2
MLRMEYGHELKDRICRLGHSRKVGSDSLPQVGSHVSVRVMVLTPLQRDNLSPIPVDSSSLSQRHKVLRKHVSIGSTCAKLTRTSLH